MTGNQEGWEGAVLTGPHSLVGGVRVVVEEEIHRLLAEGIR